MLKEPWQEGQSGNPNGRPKGSKNRSTILREILSQRLQDGRSKEYHMINALVEKALQGELGHIKEAQDTLYGKVPDKALTAETTPEKLNDDVTQQVLSKLPTEELEKIIATESSKQAE
mgnify:CR=1 FL=1